MGKNYIGKNYTKFTFDVVLMPKWRLWFWWRDWYLHADLIKKQRLWKLQIGRLMFVYWHKK